MKVVIYVDFENEEVYTKDGYNAALDEKVSDAEHGYPNEYACDFEEWLNSNYTAFDFYSEDCPSNDDLIESYRDEVRDIISGKWDVRRFVVDTDSNETSEM